MISSNLMKIITQWYSGKTNTNLDSVLSLLFDFYACVKQINFRFCGIKYKHALASIPSISNRLEGEVGGEEPSTLLSSCLYQVDTIAGLLLSVLPVYSSVLSTYPPFPPPVYPSLPPSLHIASSSLHHGTTTIYPPSTSLPSLNHLPPFYPP